ncbi:MAG: SRPBCC family protein [Hyphomonadaceae bacterium]
MRLVILLAVLLAAPLAAAQSYGVAPQVIGRRLSDGGEARASMDVRAPPEAVWAVLADCPNAQRYMPNLLSCRVIERGDGWEIREHRVRGWLLRPVMRNIARIELEPNRRFVFRRVAGDWTRSDGEWRLTPIDGGRGTHVEYQVSAALDGPLPDALSQSALLNTVRQTLVALRREAERQPAAS